MKNKYYLSGSLLCLLISLLFPSCDDYLGTIPKGEKIPVTWADYNAFIKNNMNHYNDPSQQLHVLNDIYRSTANLNSNILNRINYMWLENEDRTLENEGDISVYYDGYGAIFYWNLIIEDAGKLTECTEQQRRMLVAQARLLRAMNYFHIVNYYADQYVAANAATTPGIPLVTSASVEAPSPQVSVERIYQFILEDLNAAVEDLPETAETVLHPIKAAGYGMLARVYLSMSDYTQALKNADLALQLNDNLYDWKTYYKENQTRYDDPDDYTMNYPEVTFTNPENYIVRFASSTSASFGIYGATFGLPVERAERFEAGDTRLLTRWKKKTTSTATYYYGIRSDYFNGGGMTSAEMYHIKAECLARTGNLKGAMETLNLLRQTRILDEYYTPLTAATEEEAIGYIRRDKENEFIQTSIPFWDMRRFNKESKYARTLTKETDGVTYSLSPTSHLWTMPFSSTILTNPGNNPIEQNVKR